MAGAAGRKKAAVTAAPVVELTAPPIGAPAANARRDYRDKCGALMLRAYLPVGSNVQIVCWRCRGTRLIVDGVLLGVDNGPTE